MASFREAFAKARKEKGAGKTFTWNGKSYSTDTADDLKKSKPADGSMRPKARPASIAAKAPDRAADMNLKKKADAQAKAPKMFGNAAKDGEADRKLVNKAKKKRNSLRTMTR